MDGPDIYRVSFRHGTDLRHQWEGPALGDWHALQRAMNDMQLRFYAGREIHWCTAEGLSLTIEYLRNNPEYKGGL